MTGTYGVVTIPNGELACCDTGGPGPVVLLVLPGA